MTIILKIVAAPQLFTKFSVASTGGFKPFYFHLVTMIIIQTLR